MNPWALSVQATFGTESRFRLPGTVRETGFDTETAAIEAGAKVRQRKEKRCYRTLADTENTNNNPS